MIKFFKKLYGYFRHFRYKVIKVLGQYFILITDDTRTIKQFKKYKWNIVANPKIKINEIKPRRYYIDANL